MEIALETMNADLANELSPLLDKHYSELAVHKDIKLNPNWEQYFLMEKMGSLKFFIARNDEGEIIGYVAYFISYHIHYMDSLQAQQDVLFVSPDRRGAHAGIKLLKYSEEHLKNIGVDVITQHVKPSHDFSPLLERLGYSELETIYCKRI